MSIWYWIGFVIKGSAAAGSKLFTKKATCRSVTVVIEKNNFIYFSNYNEFDLMIANIENSEICSEKDPFLQFLRTWIPNQLWLN